MRSYTDRTFAQRNVSGCTFLPARSSTTEELQQIQDILQPWSTTPTLQQYILVSDCLVWPEVPSTACKTEFATTDLGLWSPIGPCRRFTRTDKRDTQVAECN